MSGVPYCLVDIISAALSLTVILGLRHLDAVASCLTDGRPLAISHRDFARCQRGRLYLYLQLCLFRKRRLVCLRNLDLPRLTGIDADPQGRMHVLQGFAELVLHSEGAWRGLDQVGYHSLLGRLLIQMTFFRIACKGRMSIDKFIFIRTNLDFKILRARIFPRIS